MAPRQVKEGGYVFPLKLVKVDQKTNIKKEGECAHPVDLNGWLSSGWEIVGGNTVAKKPKSIEGLKGLSKDELLKIAKNKNIDGVDGRMSEETIITKISESL